jgi:hypothetical protein
MAQSHFWRKRSKDRIRSNLDIDVRKTRYRVTRSRQKQPHGACAPRRPIPALKFSPVDTQSTSNRHRQSDPRLVNWDIKGGEQGECGKEDGDERVCSPMSQHRSCTPRRQVGVGKDLRWSATVEDAQQRPLPKAPSSIDHFPSEKASGNTPPLRLLPVVTTVAARRAFLRDFAIASNRFAAVPSIGENRSAQKPQDSHGATPLPPIAQAP